MPAVRPYHVWRRDDGYVGCTVDDGSPKPGFETLLVTHDWDEARELIVAERDTDEHRALMASWNAEVRT